MSDVLNDERVELLSAKEVAICYGVTQNTIWRWTKEGKLQKDIAGRSQMIVKQTIEARNWIAKIETEAVCNRANFLVEAVSSFSNSSRALFIEGAIMQAFSPKPAADRELIIAKLY